MPTMISAPPVMIKPPTFFDGSFLVIKYDVISIADGIMPNIEPLTLASMCKKPVFSFPAERSEEHTSELQSLRHLVCRLLLEKKNRKNARLVEDTAELH